MRKNRVTINDVADRANVSPSSVSKVLNNRPNVSPQTRAAVKQAIRELGYQPNMIAQQLASGCSNTIGLLVPNMENPHFGAISHLICHLAAREGYNLLVVDFEESPEREKHGVKLMEQKRVDGLIVAGGRFISGQSDADRTLLDMASCIPAVVLLNGYIQGSNMYSVRVNEGQAGRLAAEHFLSKGYRRFAVVTGPLDRTSSLDKLRSFDGVLSQSGFGTGDRGLLYGDFTIDGAYDAALEFFQHDDGFPLAVFALSDLMAMGVIRAAHEMGLRVPDDVAVIGYDDLQISRFYTPALSTLKNPIDRLSSIAFDVLRRIIDGRPPRQREYILDTWLIERETT